ncbi:MAG: hypothetical protein AAAC47_26655, partial [Pararhizobium sp.]
LEGFEVRGKTFENSASATLAFVTVSTSAERAKLACNLAEALTTYRTPSVWPLNNAVGTKQAYPSPMAGSLQQHNPACSDPCALDRLSGTSLD